MKELHTMDIFGYINMTEILNLQKNFCTGVKKAIIFILYINMIET